MCLFGEMWCSASHYRKQREGGRIPTSLEAKLHACKWPGSGQLEFPASFLGRPFLLRGTSYISFPMDHPSCLSCQLPSHSFSSWSLPGPSSKYPSWLFILSATFSATLSRADHLLHAEVALCLADHQEDISLLDCWGLDPQVSCLGLARVLSFEVQYSFVDSIWPFKFGFVQIKKLYKHGKHLCLIFLNEKMKLKIYKHYSIENMNKMSKYI